MARSMAVSDELHHDCVTNNLDIALICEPYNRQGLVYSLEDGKNRIIKSRMNDNHGIWAAIVIFNHEIDVIMKPQLINEHFAIASVALPGQIRIEVVSGYFQFRKETSIFTSYLESIGQNLSSRALLGLDVNAFSSRWHCPTTNQKG